MPAKSFTSRDGLGGFGSLSCGTTCAMQRPDQHIKKRSDNNFFIAGSGIIIFQKQYHPEVHFYLFEANRENAFSVFRQYLLLHI